MFEVSNISAKVTVLLDRFLFTKSLFSPFSFGQQQVFFGDTNLFSTADYERTEKCRNKLFLFPDERRESTLSLGSFNVHIVIELTVL